MHMLQTHSAQAPAALLASQPCTLPARSGDPEQVDDVVANCLQLCLQAAAHAYAANTLCQHIIGLAVQEDLRVGLALLEVELLES